MASPYEGVPVEQWQAITQRLVAEHPLSTETIREAALEAWAQLWTLRIGDRDTGFALVDLNPPAQIVGYLFEKLFARELARRLPGNWLGGVGSQKDVHCLTDGTKSIELKSSGQLGFKVYGNRSYGQQVANQGAEKKDKSGYYITTNFYGKSLSLLRFGWIDSSDWKAQTAQTGQMAGLPDDVYRYKLIPIRGSYELRAPVGLVKGIGPGAVLALEAAGVRTIADFVSSPSEGIPARYRKAHSEAIEHYRDLL